MLHYGMPQQIQQQYFITDAAPQQGWPADGPILLLAKWKKTEESNFLLNLKWSSAPRPEPGRAEDRDGGGDGA
jgi:hypothetical protein